MIKGEKKERADVKHQTLKRGKVVMKLYLFHRSTHPFLIRIICNSHAHKPSKRCVRHGFFLHINNDSYPSITARKNAPFEQDFRLFYFPPLEVTSFWNGMEKEFVLMLMDLTEPEVTISPCIHSVGGKPLQRVRTKKKQKS